MLSVRGVFEALLVVVVFAVLLPILLPLIAVILTFAFLVTVFLHIAAWCWWCSRGRYVLFVYSDSPIWRDYILEHIVPRLGSKAILLNWSERKRWRRTLGVMVFHHFGGWREFNPMAVVFHPWRRTKVLRFYEPFRDFKHGKPEAVVKLEEELYRLVEMPPRAAEAQGAGL